MRSLLLLLTVLSLVGCEPLAVNFTPKKIPIRSHNGLARYAQRDFWRILHGGHYNQIERTKKLLLAAYLENPNDPRLASHLGFLHIWKITERNRLIVIPPTIVNEIILARKFFKDAVLLNPYDARIQGFLGASMLVEGNIFNDKRQQVRGYFQLKRAIKMWPEFNYFTAGYPMSTLSVYNPHFREGLIWQWRTLDWCTDTRVNRRYPDYSRYMHLETRFGEKRACWNSWIAPHNFEGFFLNMGDMLVKQGDWRTAIRIYRNARLSRTYYRWPYRRMLEKRIRNARSNVKYFRTPRRKSPLRTVLFDSGYGCMVCHKR